VWKEKNRKHQAQEKQPITQKTPDQLRSFAHLLPIAPPPYCLRLEGGPSREGGGQHRVPEQRAEEEKKE
jgi:hypothetical protein